MERRRHRLRLAGRTLVELDADPTPGRPEVEERRVRIPATFGHLPLRNEQARQQQRLEGFPVAAVDPAILGNLEQPRQAVRVERELLAGGDGEGDRPAALEPQEALSGAP